MTLNRQTLRPMEVRDIFFNAMHDGGWATEGPCSEKSKSREMDPSELPPGHKGIEWKDGLWVVRDTWIQISGNPYSGGSTTINYDDIPVWLMQYRGWYAKEVIDFLQGALASNYRNGFFSAGRGPDSYSQGDLLYLNEIVRNDFADFECKEKVLHMPTATLKGYHNCSGLLLLPKC